MEAESVTQNVILPAALYRKIMMEIPFMENYIQDSELFNLNSFKCKNFLIQCFCHLHPDFHYLLYLKNDDIDLELMKAAGILQIYPSNHIKKNAKLFDNMNSEDIHKFWLKLFTLFKKECDLVTDTIFTWQNNISLFKDMKKALNYLNFELPIININRLKICNVNNEIKSWFEENDGSLGVPPDSTWVDDDENEQISDVDIEKLLIDLKKVFLLYNNKNYNHLEYVPAQTDFFINFINLSKNILKYKTYLNIIDCKDLEKFDFKIFPNNENVIEYMHFIKRCNNLMKTIKNKIKTWHYKVFNL